MALLEKEGERRMDAPKLIAALKKALSEADADWDVPFEQAPMFCRPRQAAGGGSRAAEAPRRRRAEGRGSARALAAIGALALASLAALFVWSGSHSTRTAPSGAAGRAYRTSHPCHRQPNKEGRP